MSIKTSKRLSLSAKAPAVADFYRGVVSAAAISTARPAKKASAAELFVKEGDSFTMADAPAAALVSGGLSSAIVGRLGDEVPLEKVLLLRTIGIDKATLSRREEKGAPLEPAEAEGVLRTIELTMMATTTFGTLENGVAWLKKPHPLLDGQSPLEYATNAYALARVKSMMSALRYGGVV